MRRSKEVPLTILAVLALSVVSCRSGRKNCVDGQNHLLPDAACQSPNSGSSGSYGSGSSGGYYGYYGAHYIYGGSSGGHVGDSVVGGSVSRGGFGGIGGSHGAGGE